MKPMKINKATYLIAELQGEIEDYVFKLRSKFNPDRTSWPTDITIAGSSGIGTITEGQDLDTVVTQLESALEQHAFNKVTFEDISRFPNTGIYILNPVRKAFDALHEAVKNINIEFNENPWPYNPHCTLCAMGENSELLENEFSQATFPTSATIRCFSLYQPEPNGGTRIHTF